MDVALVERSLVPTRTKAHALILAGRILVNGEIVRKVGTTVPLRAKLEIVPGPRYVSRGGEKLEGALTDFGLSVEGRVCFDVGASTGGFTDCLLQRGATRVYAIDVGRAQLDSKLKNDPRVVSMEETHIGTLSPERIPEKPTFAVVDVSFISLRNVLPALRRFLPPGATALPMVKPQFEVGPKHLKKGVVRSLEQQMRAVTEIEDFARAAGFDCLGRAPSRLKGPKGNQEYFLHLIAKE